MLKNWRSGTHKFLSFSMPVRILLSAGVGNIWFLIDMMNRPGFIISASFWWKTKANHHMNPKVTHFQQVLLIHLSVLLLIFWWRDVQNTEFEVNNRTLLESKIYDRIHWKFFFFLKRESFIKLMSYKTADSSSLILYCCLLTW